MASRSEPRLGYVPQFDVTTIEVGDADHAFTK
jgi:hypothetical protein